MMNHVQYYLLNDVKGQPCRNIKVKVTRGDITTDLYVVVIACDERLLGVESIVPVAKLTATYDRPKLLN